MAEVTKVNRDKVNQEIVKRFKDSVFAYWGPVILGRGRND